MKYPSADELYRKGQSLLPDEWINLYSARCYVIGRLLDPLRPPNNDIYEAIRCNELHETSASKSVRMCAEADAEGYELLVRAFTSSKIATRGIEYTPGSPPVLHDKLPLVWWCRIEPEDNPPRGLIAASDDGHPIHFLSCVRGTIRRRVPGKETLSVVTDIKVNRADLLKIVKPAPGTENTAATRVKPLLWLKLDFAKRKKDGEDRDRDTMVLAIRREYPEISRDDARKLITKVDGDLRSTRGRPERKSGPN